jgi:hypothetical protein
MRSALPASSADAVAQRCDEHAALRHEPRQLRTVRVPPHPSPGLLLALRVLFREGGGVLKRLRDPLKSR